MNTRDAAPPAPARPKPASAPEGSSNGRRSLPASSPGSERMPVQTVGDRPKFPGQGLGMGDK